MQIIQCFTKKNKMNKWNRDCTLERSIKLLTRDENFQMWSIILRSKWIGNTWSMTVVFYVHCLEVIEMMINPEMQLEWFSHLSSSRNVLGSLFTYQKGKCWNTWKIEILMVSLLAPRLYNLWHCRIVCSLLCKNGVASSWK